MLPAILQHQHQVGARHRRLGHRCLADLQAEDAVDGDGVDNER